MDLQLIWEALHSTVATHPVITTGLMGLLGFVLAERIKTNNSKELKLAEKGTERRIEAVKFLEQRLIELGETRQVYENKTFFYSLFAEGYEALEKAVSSWQKTKAEACWVSQKAAEQADEICFILESCRDKVFVIQDEYRNEASIAAGVGACHALKLRVDMLRKELRRGVSLHISAPLPGRRERRRKSLQRELEIALSESLGIRQLARRRNPDAKSDS